MGDGDRPHAAGAWKTFAKSPTAADLSPDFGDAFAINTTPGAVNVNLPKGKPADYNKTIKLRDVWRSWETNNVTLIPASGDTIKGSPNNFELYKNYMDVELVYCSPGRWEFVESKMVDRITSSNLATVARKEFIAKDGQRDFLDIFGNDTYNIQNTEVYLRGNLLHYGNKFDVNDSDFGSPGVNDTLVELDGRSIRLRKPCKAGDAVTIVTYLDGVATWRSSYSRVSIRVYDTEDSEQTTVNGKVWVGDLADKREFTIAELGVSKRESVNPNSAEVILNGKEMIRGGHADFPAFVCEGADEYETESECLENGGQWMQIGGDYSLVIDNDVVTGIFFRKPLESGDVIVLKWFNNDIGTLMEWEGSDGIKAHADRVYLNNEKVFTLKNQIEYTDYQNPSQSTARPAPAYEPSRLLTVENLFDVIHPIGTVYTNAHNKANPADYMGMGIWVPYAEGLTVVGFNRDASDTLFGINNNDLDEQGNPTATAGGTVGERAITLQVNNIPKLESTDKTLIADANGTIIIGGCQLDPDSTGPGYHKYNEDSISFNKSNLDAAAFSIVQPSITAYKWLRVG